MQYHARSSVHMKKTFFILFFSALFLIVSARNSFAQELSVTPVASASPTPISENVEYTLPYPGMLPDNPLYNLKVVRDRVIEFLISTPIKKAEFYLLSSDKRVNTGYYLIMKDKDDMGVLYISKSNNYMNMAISEGYNAKEQGNEVLQKMKTSIKKHKQLIKEVENKVDKNNRSKLTIEVKRLDKMSTLIKK